MEILAPAGSPEALMAAVAAGADAVYLGGPGFNARRNAKNFDETALAQALAYCSSKGVKTHVAFNTLLFDQELSAARSALAFVAKAGADALILQDLAAAALAKEVAPQVARHASTQMSVHTLQGALTLWEMGFSRVVLARELNRRQIGEIVEGLRARGCPLETEIFIHGAHCMCVSGQCYLSAFLGGRSGNRGLCAQPCRLPFSLQKGNQRLDYALSLKDLSLLPILDQVEKLGVDSVKIEGRMKRPEYVYAAVEAARKAREGKLKPQDMENLERIFSRSGFTDGFFQGKLGRQMFGIRAKEEQDSKTQKLMEQIGRRFDWEIPVLPGEPLPALDLSPDAPRSGRRKERAMSLWGRFARLEQVPKETAGIFKRVILPVNTSWGELGKAGLKPGQVLAELPRWNQREEELLPWLQKAKQAGIAGAVVQNLGEIPLCRQAGLPMIGGFGLNVANSLAVSEWEKLGLEQLTVSFELNLPKIRALPPASRLGMVAYGHLPLMLLRSCPNRAVEGCRACGGEGKPVRDRKGNRFLLQCAGLQKGVAPELLNPVALYLGDKKQELGCADFLWLHFTIESKSQCACVAREYAGQSRPSLREGAFTRGLYFKPIG